MSIFRKIWVWFVSSSANSQNISLTLKGLIPFLVLLGVDQTVVEATSNSVVNIVMQTGTLVTGAITLYGALRKLFYTFKPKV